MLEKMVNTELLQETLYFRQFLLDVLEEGDEIELSDTSEWLKLKIETARFVGFPCMDIRTEPIFYLKKDYRGIKNCTIKAFSGREEQLGKEFGDKLFPGLKQQFLSLKEIENLPCKEIREKVCFLLKERISRRNKQIRSIRKLTA